MMKAAAATASAPMTPPVMAAAIECDSRGAGVVVWVGPSGGDGAPHHWPFPQLPLGVDSSHDVEPHCEQSAVLLLGLHRQQPLRHATVPGGVGVDDGVGVRGDAGRSIESSTAADEDTSDGLIIGSSFAAMTSTAPSAASAATGISCIDEMTLTASAAAPSAAPPSAAPSSAVGVSSIDDTRRLR